MCQLSWKGFARQLEKSLEKAKLGPVLVQFFSYYLEIFCVHAFAKWPFWAHL
jgi:hypothetical protein